MAVLQQSGKQTFRALQRDGAGLVARTAREAGARSFVHVSAIGADRASQSAYARTKAEGEDLVRRAFPGAVILRPSIVFGPEDQFFNRFAAMARISPLMPLIGGGKTRFQPVFVGDVAQAVIAGLDGRAKPAVTYELGGPRVYSFRQLLDLVGEWSDHRRPYFPIPFWLAKLQGAMMQILPNAPLTLDQVRLLQNDNVVSKEAESEDRTLGALGIEPRAVEAIVPSYLYRFRPKGEFSLRSV